MWHLLIGTFQVILAMLEVHLIVFRFFYDENWSMLNRFYQQYNYKESSQ